MNFPRPHVVFIDSGVKGDDFDIDMVHDVEVDSKGNITQRVEGESNAPCHGTTCAGIVKKYCPDYACSSVKVLNDSNCKCDINRLVTGLLWCLEQEADIINISLGTTSFQDREKLLPIMNRLSQKSLVIAALSNRNIATYPASFANVIGVKATKMGEQPAFFDASLDGATVSAPARHSLIPKGENLFVTPQANSCAAPYITAMACKDMQQGKSISCNDFVMRLKENTGAQQGPFLHIRPDWVQRALLVSDTPFSNPTFSFEVVDVLLLSEHMRHAFEKHMTDIGVDTVIFIWRTYSQQSLKNVLLKSAARAEKDIVIIDNFSISSLFGQRNIKLWSASQCRPVYQDGIARSLNSPMIAVVDRSETRLLETCRSLSIKFSHQGYHVPFSMNRPMAVLLDGFYIEDVGDVPRHFSQMEHIYQADAHVYGMHAPLDVGSDQLCNLKQLPIDILIVFGNVGADDTSYAELLIQVTPERILSFDKQKNVKFHDGSSVEKLFNIIFDSIQYDEETAEVS
ncbi:S8 family serine peptidase [Desulfovibrio inopinatus]|uniref:S8 family serine peptidase n=1 Tax=Desulfovibrio inopinatus TaxID=102109 RepID=UPI0004207676|nr:S8 family serine peptidase [Desulfovibrio inopinatus]